MAGTSRPAAGCKDRRMDEGVERQIGSPGGSQTQRRPVVGEARVCAPHALRLPLHLAYRQYSAGLNSGAVFVYTPRKTSASGARKRK